MWFIYKEQRTKAFIGLNILFIHLIFQNYFFHNKSSLWGHQRIVTIKTKEGIIEKLYTNKKTHKNKKQHFIQNVIYFIPLVHSTQYKIAERRMFANTFEGLFSLSLCFLAVIQYSVLGGWIYLLLFEITILSLGRLGVLNTMHNLFGQ